MLPRNEVSISPVYGPPSFDLHICFVSPLVGEAMKAMQDGKTHRHPDDMDDPLSVFAMEREERMEKQKLDSLRRVQRVIR